MSKNRNENIIAALDIGTTKINCLIGEKSEDNINIIGLGQVEYSGISHGSIIHIEQTSDAIAKAKKEAELMAGAEIHEVLVGVHGDYVQSFDSSGMIAVRDQVVTEEDVERVIAMAQAVALPSDRQVLHILPNGYKVDYQTGIQNPIGMSGVRLEAAVRIVTGFRSSIANITQCIKGVGLEASHLVLQSLASSQAVLSEDEKQMGVAVVDVGGGSCDIIVYKQGRVIYTGTIGIGGRNITYDVAVGLKTTRVSAEELKRSYGSVLKDSVSLDEVVEVKSMGGGQHRNVSRKHLCEIMEARVEEMFEIIRQKLVESDLTTDLGSGIVFTGGGCLLKGFMEMAEFSFDVPLRLGRPQNAGGLQDVVTSPQFSTAVGLLLHGFEEDKKRKSKTNYRENTFTKSFHGLMTQIKDMFEETK